MKKWKWKKGDMNCTLKRKLFCKYIFPRNIFGLSNNVYSNMLSIDLSVFLRYFV